MIVRKRIVPVLMTVMMALSAWPALPFGGGAVHADGNIGKITVDGATYQFDNYDNLKNALKGMKNKRIKVEMLADWKDADSDLIVPEGSVTTLNMNAHTIDRGLALKGDARSGEVIWVQKGASLTINGSGADGAEKKAYLYTSTDTGKKPSESSLAGSENKGLLAGGSSNTGAGGIHVSWNATLLLNDVIIAGCYSSHNGGGIYYESGGRLELNRSEITGCLAKDFGGGLLATGTGGNISLNQSVIDHNYAVTGGGVYIDGDDTILVGIGESDSEISGNEAKQSGGGIALYAHKLFLSKLQIHDNKANQGGGIYSYWGGNGLFDLQITENEASQFGGGVAYGFNYRNVTKEELHKLCDEGRACIIDSTEDVDTPSAPGLSYKFFYPETSINNSTITDNKAGQGGGGVYIEASTSGSVKGQEFDTNPQYMIFQIVSLKGKVIISDNESGGNDFKNLAVMGMRWNYSRIQTELTEGSEVGISYEDNDPRETVILTPPEMKDINSELYLNSEQTGWYFKYEDGKTKRIRGDKPKNIPKTPVTAQQANNASGKAGDSVKTAGKVGTVDAAGNADGDYDLIRFFSNHDGNFDFISTVYYSDGLFYSDPYKYNEHLATASWALAYAGGYLYVNAEEVDGNKYYNKHAAARQFLADIGCPDQNIYINDSMVKKPGTNTIGVTIGSKELQKADGSKTGDILVPVTVRGLAYEQEWLSNLTLGTVDETRSSGFEAMGFAKAADEVTEEIDTYLTKYDLQEAYKEGRVKFWITGFSRAGATANMTAKRMIEKIEEDCQDNKSEVFAYPCEAAKGGTDNAEKLSETKYYCIHNMINKADIVPYVGPGEMGFKRYGVDHYIPGSDAADTPKKTEKDVIRGGEGGPTKVTTYADNDPLLTKGNTQEETTNYITQKTEMVKQLQTIDSSFVYEDYFRPLRLQFVKFTFGGLKTMNMFEVGNDENRIEDFVADFIRFAQEGHTPERVNHWSQAITSRDRYAKDRVDFDRWTSPPVQNALSDLMGAFMRTPDGEVSGFMGSAAAIIDKIGTLSLSEVSMASLYVDVIGNWYKRTGEKKESYALSLWFKLNETGALKQLNSETLNTLNVNWNTIIDLAFRFVDADYNSYPPRGDEENAWAKGSEDEKMMYLPTMASYVKQIIKYHLPQLNMAWARTYDSWYDDETTEFTLTQPASVDAPTAYVEEIKSDDDNGNTVEKKTLETAGSSDDVINGLPGDQKIFLENEDIAGEAIYYDLKEINGKRETTLETNSIYRGGIDLTLGNAIRKEYKITAYDMSYGVKSEKTTYRVVLHDTKHNVIVADKDAKGRSRNQVFNYEEGQEVVVSAGLPEDQYFKQWDVKILDDKGNLRGYATQHLLDVGTGSLSECDSAKFTMPQVGEEYTDGRKYPDGYQLYFQAEYDNRISAVEAKAIDPAAGRELATAFEMKFTAGSKTKEVSYPVVWTYSYHDQGTDTDKTVLASGEAFNDTEYTASITIPADKTLPLDPEGKDFCIMFCPEVAASLAEDPVSSGEITNLSDTNKITRNNDDGSITIQIAFAPTGNDGVDRPDVEQSFAVKTRDFNTGGQETAEEYMEYHTNPNQTVTVTAPEIPGKVFQSWSFKEGVDFAIAEGGSLADRTITITTPNPMPEDAFIVAEYIPTIQSIEADLLNEDGSLFTPEGGKAGPAGAQMFVTIAGEDYEIDPENLVIEWSPAPEDGTFAFMTGYTATVRINADDLVNVRTKGSDGSYDQKIRMSVFEAENMPVLFNGDSDQVSYDSNGLSVSKAFQLTKYTLAEVVSPDDISNVAHSKNQKSDIEEMLPATTRILTESGQEFSVEIEWTSVLPTKADEENLEETVWTATGKVALPDSVDNPNDVSTQIVMHVSVEGADTAAPPSATLASGTYLYNQVTSLNTNEADGITYYTTDGSDPKTSETRKKYEGEEIYISRDSEDVQDEFTSSVDEDGNESDPEPTGRKMMVLKAYTTKTGMWESDVAEFRYAFSNEIPVPAGASLTYDGEAQVGVDGGLFYTLEPVSEGVTLDEFGNATAVEKGTYQVKAVLNDKDACCWAPDPDDPEKNTTEDQIIEFTISHKHSLTKVEGKEATCTKAGNTEYYTCDKGKEPCGLCFKDEEATEEISAEDTVIPAIGHRWGEWKVTKAATVTATGIETRVCSNDASHKQTRVIPKKGSDPTQKAKDGTKVGPGASAACADQAITGMKSDKDPAGTVYSKLKLRSTVQTKTSISLKWNRPSGTSVFILYGNKCGAKNKMKKLGTYKTKSKKLTKVLGKKIKKGTYYKFVLVAVDKNGNVISTSKLIHIATKGGKVTNPKKVIVRKGKKGKKAVSKLTVRKGKTVRISNKVVKVSKKLKLRTHRAVKYESSDKTIATVSAKGVIKGKKKGTCYVYAYAQNGVARKVKVTVK